MAITRAYNKKSGVYYAYDVQYVWNEEVQKKVQVRKCVGKFDPETGQIIPNGKRGPKAVKEIPSPATSTDKDKTVNSQADQLTSLAYSSQQELVTAVSEGFRQINDTLQKIVEYIKIVPPASDDQDAK